MAYRIAAIPITFSDRQSNSPIAGLFNSNFCGYAAADVARPTV